MKYKFIFVDDEDYIREYFSQIIEWEELGFKLVKKFSGAEEVLSYLDNHDVDVVLTDIKMGKMLGIDLAEKIRVLHPHIIVLLLSGYKDFEYAHRGIKANVFDYLLKPISIEQINNVFHTLKNHLDQLRGGEEQESRKIIRLIKVASQYIEENYYRELTLEEVARYISFNPTYFSRYFKKHTKENFIEYLSRIRVEQASKLLLDPSIKVYQIGELVGYKSTQHFTNTFKKYKGCTPTEYRNSIDGKE